MDLEEILGAHTAFLSFCRSKERILALVEILPSGHVARSAVTRALFGDVLGSARLAADDTACRASAVLGDADFTRLAGAACVDLFYGPCLRALVQDVSPTPRPQGRQRLTLTEWMEIAGLEGLADSFVARARGLSQTPRVRLKLDACAQRFRSTWAKALTALRTVPVDMSALHAIQAALSSRGLADVSAILLSLLVDWPTGPRTKRRRVL